MRREPFIDWCLGCGHWLRFLPIQGFSWMFENLDRTQHECSLVEWSAARAKLLHERAVQLLPTATWPFG